MAILGKIRERSIFLILVIGLALFAFVISGVFDGAGTISQEPVAEIVNMPAKRRGKKKKART